MEPPTIPCENIQYVLFKDGDGKLQAINMMHLKNGMPLNSSILDMHRFSIPTTATSNTYLTSLLANQLNSSESKAPGIGRFKTRLPEEVFHIVNDHRTALAALAAANARTTTKDTASARPSDNELGFVNGSGTDLVALNNLVPVGIMVPASNLVPTNNLVPAGNLVHGSNLVPTSNQVPAGNLVPPSNLVPTNNLVPVGNLVPASNLVPTSNQVPTSNIVQAGHLVSASNLVPTSNLISASNLVSASNQVPTSIMVPASHLVSANNLFVANNNATANNPGANASVTANAPTTPRASTKIYASIEHANKIIYFEKKLARKFAKKPNAEYILADTSIQNGKDFARFEINITILPIEQKKPPTGLIDVPDLEESDEASIEKLQQLATKTFCIFYENAKLMQGFRVKYEGGEFVSKREDQVNSNSSVQRENPGPSKSTTYKRAKSSSAIQSVTKRPAEMSNIAGPSKQAKVSSVMALSDKTETLQASGTGIPLSVANKGPTSDLAGTSKSALLNPPNQAINSSAPLAPTPNANAPGPSKQANVPSISTNWDQIVAQTAPSNQIVPINPPKDTSIFSSSSRNVAGTSSITPSQPMQATTTLPLAFASLSNFPSLNASSVEVANKVPEISSPIPSKQAAPAQAVIQGKRPESRESDSFLPSQPKQDINTTLTTDPYTFTNSSSSTTLIVNDSQRSKAFEDVAAPTASASSVVDKPKRGRPRTNKQAVPAQTSVVKRSAEIELAKDKDQRPEKQGKVLVSVPTPLVQKETPRHSKRAKVTASVPTPTVQEVIERHSKQAKVTASVPTPTVHKETPRFSKPKKVTASATAPPVREETARFSKPKKVTASVPTPPIREETSRPIRTASTKSRRDKPDIKKSASNKLARTRSSGKQPKREDNTTTESVRSTSRTHGQSKRSEKAKLTTTITISPDQEETKQSGNSPSTESPTIKESVQFDWDRRYPKRVVKTFTPFVPNLEPCFVRKSKSQAIKNETSKEPDPEAEVTPRVVQQQKPEAAAAAKDPTKDKFCWKCHLSGDLHHCSRCSLGWHKGRGCYDAVFKSKLKSMTMILDRSCKKASRELYAKKQAWVSKLETVIDPTVCIECARKEAGRKFNKDHGFLSGIKDISDMKRSAALYEYAVKSLMKHRKPEEKMRSFRSLARIDYGDYEVKNKIDLNWILKKTANVTAYLCTEEFMFDIKMLCHSYMILVQKKGAEVRSPQYKSAQDLCRDLIESARSEMDSVDRCDSCYRNLYEVDTDKVESDMLMPCEHSHSVVWLQHRNLWWPGKVYEYRENTFYFRSEKHVYVVPFGDEEAGKFTQVKLLYNYSKHEPITDENEQMQEAFNRHKTVTRRKNREAHDKGIADARQYMVKYWNHYYWEKYQLPRHATPFTIDDFYHPNGGLKRKTLDGNFKLGSAYNAAGRAKGAMEEEEQDEEDTEEDDEVPQDTAAEHEQVLIEMPIERGSSSRSPSRSRSPRRSRSPSHSRSPKRSRSPTPSTVHSATEAELEVEASIPTPEEAASMLLAIKAGPSNYEPNQANPSKRQKKKDLRCLVVKIDCPEPGCMFMATTLKVFYEHQKYFHKLDSISCFAAGCDRRFSYGRAVASHIKAEHPSPVQFRCHLCARVFSCQRQTHQHWNKEHLMGLYRCIADPANCRFESINRRGIYNHLSKSH